MADKEEKLNEELEETKAAADENTDTAAKDSASEASEIEKLKGEVAEEKDRNMRLYAEFENFRRRTQRETLEAYSRAQDDFYTDILSVVDNFDRAMAQAGDDPFAVGVKMVYDQLISFLKKGGVEPIVAIDADFDPALHEAVAYQPSADKAEGKVIYETRKGYRKGDKVLRYASVIVSSGAPETEENAAKAE